MYQETDKKIGLVLPKCVNYLAEEELPEEEYFKPDWHHSKFLLTMYIVHGIITYIININNNLTI